MYDWYRRLHPCHPCALIILRLSCLLPAQTLATCSHLCVNSARSSPTCTKSPPHMYTAWLKAAVTLTVTRHGPLPVTCDQSPHQSNQSESPLIVHALAEQLIAANKRTPQYACSVISDRHTGPSGPRVEHHATSGCSHPRVLGLLQAKVACHCLQKRATASSSSGALSTSRKTCAAYAIRQARPECRCPSQLVQVVPPVRTYQDQPLTHSPPPTGRLETNTRIAQH